jgi:hypothetical protein
MHMKLMCMISPMTLTRLSMTLWVITRSTSRSCPRPAHEHCHVEILSDSDQKSWDNVTEDGKSKILDYNVQRAASRSGPPHNGQRVQNPRIQCGLNVTFDDDPQLEASTRYGSNLPATNHRAARRKRPTSLNSFLPAHPRTISRFLITKRSNVPPL